MTCFRWQELRKADDFSAPLALHADARASAPECERSQSYDGDGLRVKKTEYGWTTFYLRSSVLGGQVIAEVDGNNVWQRGYVYAGSTLMAVQQGGVFFVHEDPVTKSKRTTDINGNIVSTVELDPWGADTARSSNAAFQPKKFTSYERDANGSDEAMFRRYNRWHSRFDQPDPADGSYDATDPQSFNRYAYVQNNPVSFVDPSGLETCYTDIDGKRVCIPDIGGTVTVPIPSDNTPIGLLLGLSLINGIQPMVHLPFIGDRPDPPPRHPQNPGREMAKFDEAKLRECVKAYGFDPNSIQFTPSQRGQGGKFLGYAPWDTQRTNGIGIVNDVSYNSVQIGHMGLGPPDTGVTINGIGGRPDGRGFAEYSPYHNYTSRSLTNPIAIIATQIHELGHSLSMITGVHPETAPYSRIRPSGKPDDGTFLERCVFGGEVGNNGRLYK